MNTRPLHAERTKHTHVLGTTPCTTPEVEQTEKTLTHALELCLHSISKSEKKQKAQRSSPRESRGNYNDNRSPSFVPLATPSDLNEQSFSCGTVISFSLLVSRSGFGLLYPLVFGVLLLRIARAYWTLFSLTATTNYSSSFFSFGVSSPLALL